MRSDSSEASRVARPLLVTLAAALVAAVVVVGPPADSSTQSPAAAYRSVIAVDGPTRVARRAHERTDVSITHAGRSGRITVADHERTRSATTELWARPRTGASGALTLRWAGKRVALRSALPPKRWTHVVATWSVGRRASLYLDGQLRETYRYSDRGRTAARSVVLRGFDDTSEVRETRVYRHALDGAAVALHFQAGRELFGRDTPQSVKRTSGTRARIASVITADEPPVITGDAIDGATLTTSTGTWSAAPPIDTAQQWLRCDTDGDDCAEITGATSDAYALTEDDVGATLRVRIWATSPDGNGVATSAPTEPVRSAPPAIASPPQTEGEPVATATLTAITGAWTGTAPIAFAYQWLRCDADGDSCTEVADATSDSYDVGSADIGTTLRVTITATNPAGTQTATSGATAQVAAPEPPARIDAPVITGPTTVGATLTTTHGEWAGTAPLTFARQWSRCDFAGAACVDIEGATGETYVLSVGDIGHALRVTVRVTNGVGQADATSDATDAVVMAPVAASPPIINGDPIDGHRLSATRGGWDGTRPLSASYQWQRCDAQGEDCVNVDGAIAATYDVDHDDVNATMRVVVAVSNSVGNATATSDPTGAIVAARPSNVVRPTVGGITQVGGELLARAGRWNGTPDISYAYTWSTCDGHGDGCQPIADATADTLDITAAMVGTTVRLTVEATNALGTATATSVPSRVIGVFGATVEGLARVGETLTAVPDELLGAAPEFAYQWQRCSSAGTDCDALDGETREQILLNDDVVGATIRVVVQATSPTDVTEGRSPATAPVTAPVPVNRELPVIVGQSVVGVTVVGATGKWEPSGTPTFSWSRCSASGTPCTPIESADDSAYTVKAADVGSRLQVSVTETSSGGTATVASRLGPVVVEPALVNTAAPTIERVPGPTGDVLAASHGEWDGDSPITYTYDWLACDTSGGGCERIPGATGPELPLQRTDIGTTKRVVVGAENTAGRETARSAPTAPIGTDLIAVGLPASIAGTPKSGEMLSMTGATWTGIGPLDFAYQWRRCDTAGDDCDDIPAANGQDYIAVDDDVGHSLRLATIATGPDGTASTVTDSTAPVGGPDAPPSGPTATIAPSISGTIADGETLTANPGTWSSVGLLTFDYQWRMCDAAGGDCTDIAGATEATFIPGSGEVGHALAVRVLAEDGTSSSAAIAITPTSVRAVDGPANETAPVVSGIAREAQELSATNGTWSSSGALTYEVRWQRCDDSGWCADIDDAAANTHELTDEDVDGTLRAVLTARDEQDRETTVTSAQTSVIAPATPINRAVPTITGTTETGAALHADAGTWDGLAPLMFGYQWQSCDLAGESCADVDGATTADYPLGQGDGGTTLRVVVSATNGLDTITETSDASAPVSDAGGPIQSAPPTITGLVRENGTLIADPGDWAGTGEVTYSYRWMRCDSDATGCGPIAGATDHTLALASDLVFSVLRVEVTAHDDVGSRTVTSPPTEPVESAAADTNAVIINTARPSISGEPRVGVALTASPGEWEDAAGLNYRYRWWSCDAAAQHCHLLPDATDASLTPGMDDLERRIRVMVTAASGAVSVTIMSPPSTAIAPPRPMATVAPAISGDAVDASMLSTDHGTWIPDGVQFEERWQRCDEHGEACSDIPGATGPGYRLTPGDVGHTVRSVITGTNHDGVGTAASEPSTTIAALPPSATWEPWISGLARQQGALTATAGGFDGSPELSYAFAWHRCNENGEACEPIASATEQTYTLTASDLGARILVEVTATNSAGQATSTSQPSDVVDAPAAPQHDAAGNSPMIHGDANDGQQLLADPGDWIGASPLTYTYQWESCDAEATVCTAISGATEQTYDVTLVDLGTALRVTITAHNPTGTTVAISQPTDVIETGAPLPHPGPWIGGTASTGGQLEASPGDWSGSKPMTFNYQWRRCDADGSSCSDIEGETGEHYSVRSDDPGQWIDVAVTATNAHGTHTANTDPTKIHGLKPQNLSAPTIDGTAHTNQWLTATPGEWSFAASYYSYQWQSCNATGTNCEDLASGYGPSLFLGEWLAGHTVRVVVKAEQYDEVDPPAATSATSSMIGTANALNVTPPTLSSDTASTDFPITVSPGEWLGDSITYSYQWRRCQSGSCSDIDQATQAMYLPDATDTGYTLVAAVTATTSTGNSTVTTAASKPVGPSGPRNLIAPMVDGDPVVGGVMWSTTGDWTASAYRFTAKLLRCDAFGNACVAIPDTAGEYRLRRADLGHTLRSVVVATGTGGSTTAVSGPTNPIAPGTRPAFATAPTLEGTPAVGEWVSGGDPELTGTPEIQRSGQWERCDPSGDGCNPIPGATEWWYQVQRADAGFTLRLRASITNGWGTVTRRTEPTTTILPAPSIVNEQRPHIQDDQWWIPRPLVGTVLWADAGTWTGSPNLRGQWQRCDPLTLNPQRDAADCVDIEGATDLLNYNPALADIGQLLRLKVTGTGPNTQVDAYTELTDPVRTQLWFTAAFAGPVAVGEAASVVTDIDTRDGLPTTIKYKWEASAYDHDLKRLVVRKVQEGASATYTPTEQDRWHSLSVTVTVTKWSADRAYFAAGGESTTIRTVQPALANTVVPSVSGGMVAGDRLTVHPGTWQGGDGPILFEYGWQRCDGVGEECSPIDGATGSQYQTTADDIGHQFKATVGAYIDRGDGTEDTPTGSPRQTLSSASVGPIGAGERPASTDAPTISGAATERGLLEASNGTWRGSEPITYAHQWQTCAADGENCRDIRGATSASYRVRTADYVSRLRVIVTATNAMGSEHATSASTDPVDAGDMPDPTSLPSLTLMGPLAPGSTLISDGGTWKAANATELSYAWQRCDASGNACTTIDRAIGAQYQLTEEDAEHRLRVVVTATTNAGEASAISDVSDTVGTGGTSSAAGRVAYIDGDRTSLQIASPDGTGPSTLANCTQLEDVVSDCQLYRPRIAPNLRIIAFEARSKTDARGTGAIYLINIDGTGLRHLTTGSDPAWTPDGTDIIYTAASPNGGTRAMLVGADGTHPEEATPAVFGPPAGDDDEPARGAQSQPLAPLSTAPLSTESPDVADDGRIVFVGRRGDDDPGLYVAEDSSDQGPRRIDLGDRFALVSDPRFTPDGHAIVFSALLDDKSRDGTSLWEVSAAGSGLHRVSPDDGKLYSPAAPTDHEVLTTRSDFELCGTPTFAGGMTATRGNADICEVTGARGYGINHDGSNPHFLGLQNARDIDAPVRRRPEDAYALAERIRAAEALIKVEDFAIDGGKQAGKTALRKKILSKALKAVARHASKVGIASTIGAYLADDGNLGCELRPFVWKTNALFTKTGLTLAQVINASVAPHPVLASRVSELESSMESFHEEASRYFEGTTKKCKAFYRGARDNAAALLTLINQNGWYLLELDYQHQRGVAHKAALEAVAGRAAVGTRTCGEQAAELLATLGAGANRRNYVVYWAPPAPPPELVRYIGLSRNLPKRCADHPEERSKMMTTLNLPPLNLENARNVEEALIAHFGLRQEPKNDAPFVRGQLENKRHEVSPDRLTYCDHLLIGQFILKVNPVYVPYAAAHYTRGKKCPGVEGPR